MRAWEYFYLLQQWVSNYLRRTTLSLYSNHTTKPGKMITKQHPCSAHHTFKPGEWSLFQYENRIQYKFRSLVLLESANTDLLIFSSYLPQICTTSAQISEVSPNFRSKTKIFSTKHLHEICTKFGQKLCNPYLEVVQLLGKYF